MTTFIGIDPGHTGAIVAIHPDGAIEFHDMPTLQLKKKLTINYCGLADILSRYQSHESMAAIELVGAMPGQGLSSSFNFGRAYGAVLGTIATLQIPYQSVSPVKWKREFNLLCCEKDESRARALQLFPSSIEHLKLKKHCDRADALLMAEFLRRSVKDLTSFDVI